MGAEGAGVRTYAAGGPGAPLIDFSSIFTWRTAFALAAVLYIAGFHITLPGLGRIRI